MANGHEVGKPIRVEARGPKSMLTMRQFVAGMLAVVLVLVIITIMNLPTAEDVERALEPFQTPLSYAFGLSEYPDDSPVIEENIDWMDVSLNTVSPELAARYIDHFALKTGESMSLQALLEADGAKILFDLPVNWNQRTQEARVLVVSIPDVWRFAGVELVDEQRGCAAKPLRFPGVTPSKRLYVCLGDAGFMNILVITAS